MTIALARVIAVAQRSCNYRFYSNNVSYMEVFAVRKPGKIESLKEETPVLGISFSRLFDFRRRIDSRLLKTGNISAAGFPAIDDFCATGVAHIAGPHYRCVHLVAGADLGITRP
jgi:hypothetical protein